MAPDHVHFLEVFHEPGRTSNIEHRMAARILLHFGVRCSMLDVRCSPSIRGFIARIFISGSAPASGAANGALTVGIPAPGAPPDGLSFGYRVRRGARGTAAVAPALPTAFD